MNSWDMVFLYLGALLLLSGILLASLIILIIKAVKKLPKQAAAITSVISAVVLVAEAVFIATHSTYIRYNDAFVLGSSITEVEKVYGAFDTGSYRQGNRGEVGYYIYTDNGSIMPDHLDHYYYICYDENGIVHKVYDGSQRGG